MGIYANWRFQVENPKTQTVPLGFADGLLESLSGMRSECNPEYLEEYISTDGKTIPCDLIDYSWTTESIHAFDYIIQELEKLSKEHSDLFINVTYRCDEQDDYARILAHDGEAEVLQGSIVYQQPQHIQYGHETCPCDDLPDHNKEVCAQWSRYINYLHDWANRHSDVAFMNCSPVCFDEWADNEDLE